MSNLNTLGKLKVQNMQVNDLKLIHPGAASAAAMDLLLTHKMSNDDPSMHGEDNQAISEAFARK